MLIYENICEIAKENGYSINQLEKEAGVSKGSICKWGNRVSPTVGNLQKVASVLKCRINDLIDGPDAEEV